MLSINTNASALTALQALENTQQALNQTEEQVSTGYAVNTAADNASYFSIATQLKADSGIVTAANTALGETQAVLSTASSAISSVLTTINSIQTALTQAQQPNADITDINTQLKSLGAQLTDAINGASFNGLNLLNGSQDAAALNFVSGFTADSTGGNFNTIGLQTAALYTGASAGTAGSTGTLVQTVSGTGGGTVDLTDIQIGTGTGQSSVATALSGVEQAQLAVTNYAAILGSTQDRATAASTLNTAVTTNYATGTSSLIDADMNQASTRLQALQTQQQLGIQSLSIANQNSQLILKLFGG